MVSFSDILSKRASDAKEPPLKPVGTYLFMAQGQHQEGESSQKKTKFVGWEIKALSAGEDVNQEELEEAGGLKDWVWKPSARGGCRFWLTDDALYQLKAWMVDVCGIESGEGTAEERSLKDMMTEVPGKQFYVTVTHRPNQEGTRMFMEIAGYARV